MKKTLVFIVSLLAILGIGNAVFACEQISFDSYGTICVDLNKNGNTYNLDVDYNNLTLSYSNAYYYVLLPNSAGGLLSPRLTDNSSQFSYNYNSYGRYNSAVRKVKVYAVLGNQVKSTEVYYDFANGYRSNQNNNNNNSTYNNFTLSTNITAPSAYQRVNLIITPNSSYSYSLPNTVNFQVYYQTPGSSYRYLTTSSSYYTLGSSYSMYNNTSYGYSLSSYYNNIVTLSNFIEFTNSSYNYKVRVTDTSNSSNYQEIYFYMNGSNNNNTSNNFTLSTNITAPSAYQRVNLIITPNSSYSYSLPNTVNFQVYYQTPGSSYRYLTTSSSYYTLGSSYSMYNNTSYGYSLSSYYNNIVTLSNFIEFTNSSYNYKVRVTDTSNSSNYQEIYFYMNGSNNNNTSNGNINNFYVTNSNSSPDINERLNLTITARDINNSTISNFADNIRFIVYYRVSASDAWTPTTSSNYYIMGSNYANGYYFNTSNYGIATLTNFIEFKQRFEYKIVVQDTNNASVNGYALFDLRNQTSNVNGFSIAQMDALTTIYNSRNRMITSLKNSYPRLRNNNTWIDMSNTFYNNMQDVINNTSYKTFTDYGTYIDAFTNRYSYTIANR